MSMETITISNSLDDELSTLASLDGLVSASEWHRAAIVYAFTYEGVNQYDAGKEPYRHTITKFASRGIKGLSSKPTVIAYRRRWKQLVEADSSFDIGPGDSVTLPDIPWKVETIDESVLDSCVSELGKIHAIEYRVRDQAPNLANDDQRMRLGQAVREHADKLMILAMELENEPVDA